MRGRILVGALGALAVLMGAAIQPVAAAEKEEHCVAQVTPPDQSRTTPTEITCFATFDEAMRSLGVEQSNGPVTRADVDSAMAASRSGFGTLSIIAIHYTNTGYGGSSLTINGGVCNGGSVNFAFSNPGWNDNVESTHYYCGGPYIHLYDDWSCTGSGDNFTSHKSTHGFFNNRGTCIVYGP